MLYCFSVDILYEIVYIKFSRLRNGFLNTNTNFFAIFRRIFDTAVVKHVSVTDKIHSLHCISTANLRWNDFI